MRACVWEESGVGLWAQKQKGGLAQGRINRERERESPSIFCLNDGLVYSFHYFRYDIRADRADRLDVAWTMDPNDVDQSACNNPVLIL